jgi:undecaprenyl phosphate-alpha-L-ara4FN deformylase
VRWQDQIDSLGESGIRSELNDAFEAYRSIMGEAARAFAAPGWRTNAIASRALDDQNLDYRSDTRGHTPFRCMVEGRVLTTPEIPTTLPTLDEVMGRPDLPDNNAVLRFYLDQFKDDGLNVHTIHAETEGMGQLESFTALIRALKERGAQFVRMDTIAARLNRAELPTCEIVPIEMPGRSGWVAGQRS